MAYNSTTWSPDVLTAASETSSDELNNATLSGTLTVSGATQLNSTLTVGVDSTGYDVKFYGDTSSKYMLWDESDDSLYFRDNTYLRIGSGATDLLIYHDGTDSHIKTGSGVGTLNISTSESGVAVSIGHTTSVTTINDELDVTGTVDINDATDASSTTTGALKVDGGVGIVKKLYVGDNVIIAGDLTVTGADVILGMDADGTDRTITFGHSTLKTIMGIDDSADRFVINTDASFDGTIGDNHFSIDASGNAYVSGKLVANQIELASGDGITNSSSEVLSIASNALQVLSDSDASAQLFLVSGAAGQDSQLLFYEAASVRWSLGHDASDNTDYALKWDFGNSTVGGATKMTLASDGDLTIAGLYKGYMPWIHEASFTDNDADTVFIPLGSSLNEDTSPDADDFYSRIMMPYAGYLEKIIFRPETVADTCDFEIYKAVAGTDANDADQNKLSSTVSVESDTADTSVTATFGTGYSFAVGDVMAIKMTYETAPIDVDLSIVWRVLVT